MSVSGLCAVCHRPDVNHGCDRCGQVVCNRHWDRRLGLCVECGAEVEPRRHVQSEEAPDGVDTYRF